MTLNHYTFGKNLGKQFALAHLGDVLVSSKLPPTWYAPFAALTCLQLGTHCEKVLPSEGIIALEFSLLHEHSPLPFDVIRKQYHILRLFHAVATDLRAFQ